MIEYEKIDDSEYFKEHVFGDDIITIYSTTDVSDNWNIDVNIHNLSVIKFKHLGDFDEDMIFREVYKQILRNKHHRKSILYTIFA